MSTDLLHEAAWLLKERGEAAWHPALANWLEDIAERHGPEPEPVELMLHYDEPCPDGSCADGNGHECIVCAGCYPTWDGMDGHCVYPCLEAKAALAVARAYLGSES